MLGIRQYGGVAADLWCGDITTFFCDVMVNATDGFLSGAGGVDFAIHKIGGPVLKEQCHKIASLSVGEIAVTAAGDLPCTHVIHAFGPKWQGGSKGEASLLEGVYRKALTKAEDLKHRHIALCSIGTGVFKIPKDQASKIFMVTLKNLIDEKIIGSQLKRVTMVLYDNETYDVFQNDLFKTFPDFE